MIYFDNAATTKPLESVIKKMSKIMEENYANSSSTHNFGIDNRKIIENCREYMLNFINANKGTVVFTSGGTEANNLAIFGNLKFKKNKKSRIITTKIEHDSVLNSVKFINEQYNDKVEIIYLKTDLNGNINLTELSNFINEYTILVSIMMVNNETGSVNPIEEISKILQKKRINNKILLHVDAVQAFGKIPIDVSKLGIDLLSVSAHKIHGPKGIGFLYVKEIYKIKPIIFGGGQENNIRSGTESIELISGFKEALINCDLKKDYDYIKKINNYTIEKIKKNNNFKINSPQNSVPHIINFSIKNVKSEIILNFLSSKKIYLSSASACTKNKKSHVLKSMGLSDDIIDSSVRISFSKFNNEKEIDTLLKFLNNFNYLNIE